MPLCASSENVRAGRAAIAFARRPAAWFDGRCFRGLPVLVHEVYRCAWGLRLRWTEPRLALSPLFVLHSHIFKTVSSGMIFSELNTHPTYPLSTLRGLPPPRTLP